MVVLFPAKGKAGLPGSGASVYGGVCHERWPHPSKGGVQDSMSVVVYHVGLGDF